MTTILLVDDHPMVREGVRAAFSAVPGWSIVGEASNGHQALDLVARLQPAIMVMDLQLPDLSGLDILRQLMAHSPAPRVIIFSMHAEDAYVRQALAAGAAGYVLKEAGSGELIDAVRAALRGERFISRALTDRMITAYLEHPPATTIDWSEMLTARERQVLVLAAQGLNNSTIADRLGISPRTAETHRTNLMRKLGLKTQAELTRYAQERRLIDPTP